MAQSESTSLESAVDLQQQCLALEAAWSALLVLPAVEAQARDNDWRPLAQAWIDGGRGQVLLLVLEGVLRQAPIRSQRQTLLALCDAMLQWPPGSEPIQHQWALLRRWLG